MSEIKKENKQLINEYLENNEIKECDAVNDPKSYFSNETLNRSRQNTNFNNAKNRFQVETKGISSTNKKIDYEAIKTLNNYNLSDADDKYIGKKINGRIEIVRIDISGKYVCQDGILRSKGELNRIFNNKAKPKKRKIESTINKEIFIPKSFNILHLDQLLQETYGINSFSEIVENIKKLFSYTDKEIDNNVLEMLEQFTFGKYKIMSVFEIRSRIVEELTILYEKYIEKTYGKSKILLSLQCKTAIRTPLESISSERWNKKVKQILEENDDVTAYCKRTVKLSNVKQFLIDYFSIGEEFIQYFPMVVNKILSKRLAMKIDIYNASAATIDDLISLIKCRHKWESKTLKQFAKDPMVGKLILFRKDESVFENELLINLNSLFQKSSFSKGENEKKVVDELRIIFFKC